MSSAMYGNLTVGIEKGRALPCLWVYQHTLTSAGSLLSKDEKTSSLARRALAGVLGSRSSAL